MTAAIATLSDLRQQIAPVPAPSTLRMGFGSAAAFELLQRAGKAFAASTLVPQAYAGNLPNCMVALELADRMGASPLLVMQNLYIVHGSPGWSSKFLIASVNVCGRFSALRYEWRGEPGTDGYGCRAWAIEKSTGERLDGIWVDWKMVKAEGWSKKAGSKWQTMPDQMFVYRAAAFWQRAYAPEISMGLSTQEELHDVVDVRDDGRVVVTSEALRADMQRADSPAAVVVDATHDAPTLLERIAATDDVAALEALDADARALPDGAERDGALAALKARLDALTQ